MVNIAIAKTTSDSKCLNKVYYVINQVTCRIKGDCDIMNPTFIVNANNDYVNANYLYCSTWNKWYFITKPPTVSEGGTMEISCEEDVLMTFNRSIASISNAHVVRSETIKNDYIPDTAMLINANPYIQVESFGLELANDQGYNYVLEVI